MTMHTSPKQSDDLLNQLTAPTSAFHLLLLPLAAKLAADRDRALKQQHKFKCMGIAAAVSELHNRLSLLQQQNAERSALEQLLPEDFVVDLARQAALVTDQQQAAQQLTRQYQDRNTYVDLLAARLRQRVFDTMETPATFVVRPLDVPRSLQQEVSSSTSTSTSSGGTSTSTSTSTASASGGNNNSSAAAGGAKGGAGGSDAGASSENKGALWLAGVSSLPTPALTPADASLLAKVQRLRRLELRAIRRSLETTYHNFNLHFNPGSAAQTPSHAQNLGSPGLWEEKSGDLGEAGGLETLGQQTQTARIQALGNGIMQPIRASAQAYTADTATATATTTATATSGATATAAQAATASATATAGAAAGGAQGGAGTASLNPQYRTAWAANLHGLSRDTTFLVNDGVLWPLHPHRDVAIAEVAAASLALATGAPPAATTSSPPPLRHLDSTLSNTQPRSHSDDFTAQQLQFLDALDATFDDHHLSNLLYAPPAARTGVQKRNQVLWLQEVVRQLQTQFNTRCAALRAEKEEVHQLIDARNGRIVEILDELQGGEPSLGPDGKSTNYAKVWSPAWHDDERLGSAILVQPFELKHVPYESTQMRDKRLKEAAERDAKRSTDPEEANKQRALIDMMNGTLEVKRDLLAAEALLQQQKPAWLVEKLATLHANHLASGGLPLPTANPLTELSLLTPATDLSETQQKDLDAYVQKIKVLQEEQAHYKKALEQEMKKLKTEIVDTCRAFNDKLDALQTDRVVMQKDVLTQELYMAQLSSSLVQAEHTRTLLTRLQTQLTTLLTHQRDLRTTIDAFTRQCDDVHKRILVAQEESKGLENAFRRDLQALCEETFDQDTLNHFKKLYRKRTKDKSYYDGDVDPDDPNQNNQDNDNSNADISASQSRSRTASHSNMKRSKDASASARGGGNNRSQSRVNASAAVKRKGGGGANKNMSSASAQAGAKSDHASSVALGPMQQAAQALRSLNEVQEQLSYKAKDPFYHAIHVHLRTKLKKESQLPSLTPLSMEHDLVDFPADFLAKQTQFIWAKLQELRNAKIEKEIEEILLTQEHAEARAKLQMLLDDETALHTNAQQIKHLQQSSAQQLVHLEHNLDVLVSLLQGQDEVDRDAVATDYTTGLLLPINVLGKFNARIKELGAEKITVLSKIKLFRRKINAIDWEAHHQALQAKHYESYYTDLQLFRVTRDLQKVILEGENAFNQKERVEKIGQRRDYLSKEFAARHAQLQQQQQQLQRQCADKATELQLLQEEITEVEGQVSLSLSIKQSREVARGNVVSAPPPPVPSAHQGGVHGGASPERARTGSLPVNAAAVEKMKKVVGRKHLVDIAKAQAEEIDFLRQELDRMRQRTFPSFVKATKNRLNGQGY